MTTHKALKTLEKVTSDLLGILCLLYGATLKEYVVSKGGDLREFYIIDEKTIGVDATTSLAKGMKKLRSLFDVVPNTKSVADINEGVQSTSEVAPSSVETVVKSTIALLPEVLNVFRLIGFEDVCKVYKQNKELAYKLFASKIYSFLKTINNA
jgi:hypothetical protein